MGGTLIEYRANGGTARGYLATPAGSGAGPGNGKGVVVIQEWWGLVPHIEDVTRRFAAQGYVALAPDLWDGQKTTEADEATRLFMALNIDDASKKIAGAAQALHAHGAKGKVGVVGFCMGGIVAIHAAAAHPDLFGAVVDFYGAHPHVHPAWDDLKAPVMAIIGERDEWVTPATAQSMKDKIQAAGGSCTVHLYPAGHAFFNDARAEVHDPASSRDAWAKVNAFLAASL